MSLTLYRCPHADCGWAVRVDREWSTLLRDELERARLRDKLTAKIGEHDRQHAAAGGCRACRAALAEMHVEGCPVADGFVWPEHAEAAA